MHCPSLTLHIVKLSLTVHSYTLKAQIPEYRSDAVHISQLLVLLRKDYLLSLLYTIIAHTRTFYHFYNEDITKQDFPQVLYWMWIQDFSHVEMYMIDTLYLFNLSCGQLFELLESKTLEN